MKYYCCCINGLTFDKGNCEKSETNFDDFDDVPLPTLEEVAIRVKETQENFLKTKVLTTHQGN